LAASCLSGNLAWAGVVETFPARVTREIEAVEKASGGRLGVAVLDTATGERANYHGDERFPMCSTFKLLAAGAVLAKVDGGTERLDRLIRFEAKDVVEYSPVTASRAGGTGMPLREICAAAITYSDNTAGNLLLSTIGGPAGLNRFARSLGDEFTRLDRWETGLNEALPGDPRDTTTPTAMLEDVHGLVFGHALSAASREQLTDWMLGCKTGDAGLRAGVPKGWRIGDKTGSGKRGSTNDVAVLWPPDHAPVIVSVYSTGSAASYDERSATIAKVGKAVAAAVGIRAGH
jgi:beta-lactamase class A